MKALLLLTALLAPAHAATLLRIACGSPTGGTDAAGRVWQPDAYFAGGTAYATPALAALDQPYRTLRYGSFSYALPVAPGKYTVTLSFVENRTAASAPPVAAGQRRFSVTVNGVVAVANLDLFAAAGSLKPYTVTVPVTQIAGPLSIAVAPALGNALLSAIQVDSVELPPPPVVAAQWSCESGDVGDGSGVGSLMPGVRHYVSCENMSAGPLRIVKVRVRADGAGAVLDLMTPDSTGAMKTLLVSPVPSSPDGNEGAALPQATYPPGAVLHWMFRINDSVDPAVHPASFVLATVVMEAAK